MFLLGNKKIYSFGRKLGLPFNNVVLVVEQNKYGVKIIYACIVYDFRKLAN